MSLKWFVGVLLIFSFSKNGYTQITPPTISAQGNQEFCGIAPMNIVTSVSISNTNVGDTNLDNVFVQISEGYTINQDVLILTGTHPNITTTWNTQEGKLTLQGPANFVEFENAISDVLFQTTQTNFTQDKSFSINLGDANFLPSTGHYYLYIPSDGITWTESRDAAQNLEYFGLQGYLATLTSEEEAQFAGEQSLGTGWIGATDTTTEGTWTWVTGPEEGLIFWIGSVNGSSPGSEFSYWNTGEPNNLDNEDYAHITDPSIGNIGSWNDLPNIGDGEDLSSPYFPRGYFVEFGGMPGDPEINLSASTTIITPKVIFDNIIICDEGEAIIELTSNTDIVQWYETPSSTIVINEGSIYTTFLTTTTTFWVLPLFNGCSGGARIPITVTVQDLPIANDIIIVQCDDGIQDGITSFNLTISEENITGEITGTREINYYEDAGLTIEIEENNYTNVANPQIIYAEVLYVDSGCSSIAQITLETAAVASGNSALIEICDDIAEDGFVFFNLSLADNQILDGVPVGATVAYFETFDDAILQINSLPNSYFNTSINEQIIYARIDNNADCYSITEVVLRVIGLPQLSNTLENVYYCLNTFPQTITLDSGVINDTPNNYSFNWSTGETTMAIEVNAIGTYSVIVTEPDGCSIERIINVLASNSATIQNVVVIDFSNNNTVSILVSVAGDFEYSIIGPSGPFQESNTFENLVPGIYTVYVRDTLNVCGTVSEEVSIIGYPKFFTPNGDSFNDTWQIKGISEQFQLNTKVYIFDRFGKLLYTLNSPSDTWDGTFNGQPLPTSDYWFSATLGDGRTFTNHFTLKR